MIEVKYYLAEEDNTEFNMLDELRSLQNASNILFFNKDNKKKKKKDKKNNELTELISADSDLIFNAEIERLDDDTDDDDDIHDSIVNKQKKGYNKLKKAENSYKKEFAEELTLLYTLLSESNSFSKKLEKKFDTVESMKTRNSSKYVNDLINSIIMSKNSRLSILKEITNIKKIISDLKLKDIKSKDDKASTVEQLASSYLKNIISYGRHNFIKDASFNGIEDADESFRLSDDLNEHEYSSITESIDSRLDALDRDSYYRTDESNKIIAYEKKGAKIVVQRNIESGEWDFIATDKNNQILEDYPLPNKKFITKMKFADDGNTATDQYGRSYKVIETYDF